MLGEQTLDAPLIHGGALFHMICFRRLANTGTIHQNGCFGRKAFGFERIEIPCQRHGGEKGRGGGVWNAGERGGGPGGALGSCHQPPLAWINFIEQCKAADKKHSAIAKLRESDSAVLAMP